jgi:hypothetical protein
MAGGTVAAAALGGPLGVAALGGLGAVAAIEYLGARGPGGDGRPLEELGTPSQAALQMVEKLNAAGPGPVVAGGATASAAVDGSTDALPPDSPRAKPG